MNLSRREAFALLFALCVGTAACRHDQPAAPRPRPVLKIATAFGPFSEPLTTEYRRRLTYLDVQSEPTPDSEAVIAAIQAGTVDLGVTLADVAYYAYWGSEDRAPAVDSQLRGVSLLQPLPQYLLVRGGSGIRTVSDLRGRVIALGPRTSPTSALGMMVLQAFQAENATVKNVTSRAEAAEGLKSGTIDAAFLPGYVYPDEVTYSAIQAGAYLIPIDGPEIDRLRLEHPFVRVAYIPREIYRGQDRIIPTVGVDMVVLCRRDLDAAVVYDLTAQLFNAFPRLSGVEATLRFLNPDEAPATPIPLHPGAARYFRERELSR